MNATTGPVAQGNYRIARRHGGTIYTSGMTPRRDGAMLMAGPVPKDAALETYREAVELACGNALAAARGQLSMGERLEAVLSLTVFIAAEAGFTAHARLADFASALIEGELGPQGVGTRAAVGVATLPGNAPVEIQLIAIV